MSLSKHASQATRPFAIAAWTTWFPLKETRPGMEFYGAIRPEMLLMQSYTHRGNQTKTASFDHTDSPQAWQKRIRISLAQLASLFIIHPADEKNLHPLTKSTLGAAPTTAWFIYEL